MVLTECPRSFVRAASVTLLEEHHAWRMGGRGDLRGYSAKSVEAFIVLENELLREKTYDE